MSNARPPLAVIAGPTASGKSALAIEWAKATGGAIVNCDASQLYRGLDIVSAAPTAAGRAVADHRLYACRDPAESCSTADYAALAKAEIAAIHASGRPAVLVGGTGLYLRTLLDGIAPVPPIDPAVRAEVRAAPVPDNRARLEQLDPQAAARLKPADTARIARALEVVLSTGRTLADWQQDNSGGIGGKVALRPLILLPPRDWLYRRCDQRFAAMLDSGADAEVKALMERKLDPALPAMRAIGVREIAAMLAGAISCDEAIAFGSQSTRRYAKRQYTWFAHQPPPDWPRFAEPLDSPGAMARALALLGAGD